MLRFLYLLSFLLCIELSFCYNYIDEAAERNPIQSNRRNVRRDRIRRLRRPKEKKILIRQEYDYDKSPVEFDVASFIQPEEETLDDEEAVRHRNKKRRRIEKSYDYSAIMGLEDGLKKRDKTPDYLNIGDSPPDLNINPPLFKDSINTKHLNNYNSLDDLHSEKYGHEKFRNIYKDDLLMDQNVVHNHEKKCTLKHIKFPFFSHNKSEPIKPKTNRKRKLFCFNCPKKENHALKLPDDSKIFHEPILHYKKKRSYQEKLCPACKKIFLNSDKNKRRRRTPKRIIHNSRQFYQTNLPETKLKENVKSVRKNNFVYSDDDYDAYFRKKREDDRERQLKELEEVQRKIDNVEIHLPTFVKPHENSQ